MLNSINLEDSGNQVSNIFRTASENARNWFAVPAKPKLESFCEFQRKNKIRWFRTRKIKSGEIVLTLKDKDGNILFEKAKNLPSAFVKLQRSFYSNLQIN